MGTSVLLSLPRLVALEELWFVQEALSSLSDTGEAVLSEEGRVLAVGSVLYFESAQNPTQSHQGPPLGLQKQQVAQNQEEV